MEKLYKSRKEKIKKNVQETPKEFELVTRVMFIIKSRMNKNIEWQQNHTYLFQR
jgi:hypothetical protein